MNDDPARVAQPKHGPLAIAIVRLASVLMMVILGWFFYTEVRNGYWSWLLRSGGEPAVATVVQDGGRRDPCVYEFAVGDRQFRGTGRPRGRTGDTVRVLYLPQDPEVNRPAGARAADTFMAAAVLVGGGAFALFGGVPRFRRWLKRPRG